MCAPCLDSSQLRRTNWSTDRFQPMGLPSRSREGLMREQLRGRLAKNASWMFLGQGVSFVVQACYFVLLARLLGSDQYGSFVGAAAAVSLLSQYSTLGSGLVLVRQVSRVHSDFPQ